MPREQSDNRKKARQIYDEHNGQISNREIARILDCSEKSVSGWKCKDNWTGKERSTPNKNNRSTPKGRKRGGQPGNKNATGPPGNQNARKHGLFAKYLPPALNAIIDDEEMPTDPLDLLWDQINIMYANIVHAQGILYVSDKDDLSKEISMSGDTTIAYALQYAWDKQASNISALSRSMNTLKSMIRDYEDLLGKRTSLASEEQRARIDHMKAQTKKLETEKPTIDDKVTIIEDIPKGGIL